MARESLEQFAAGAEAYEQAAKNGFTLLRLRIRASVAWWRAGNKEKAFEWLERGMKGGASVALLCRLPPLEDLRSDPRFETQAAKYDQPCEQLEHRAFDFWLGEWDVEDPQGRNVGPSRVEKILNDCMVYDNWTGDNGGSGKSFNFYNPGAGKWKQTWVDDGGRMLDGDGEFQDGAMRFAGVVVQKDGSRYLYRMTFTPCGPDRVRQLIEKSADGGRNWHVWFDGTYIRKK